MIPYADPDVLDDDDPPGETSRPALHRALVIPRAPLAPKVAAVIRPPPERLAEDRSRTRTKKRAEGTLGPCVCCGRGTCESKAHPALAPFCRWCRRVIHATMLLGVPLDVAIARKLRGAKPGEAIDPREAGTLEALRRPCAVAECRGTAPLKARHPALAALCMVHREKVASRIRSRRERAPVGQLVNEAAIVAEWLAEVTARRAAVADLRAWASRGASDAAE